MPDLTNIQIPPPANWQDFERLCADLWTGIWRDLNTQLNGRSGQPQAGVDIWGHDHQSPEVSAVQCKGKDGGYRKKVTCKDLKSEVKKAKKFSPRIAHFIIATTARNDSQIQQLARKISARHRRAGLFTVDVVGWDEISRRIAGYPDVFKKHYPQFALASSGAVYVDVSSLIEPAPDEFRRSVKEPFLQGFSYRTSRMDNHVEISADVPYRDVIAKGGPVTGLWFSTAPLIGQFPNLDIKVVNNRPETVFLCEAAFRVKTSTEVDDVIPLFVEPATSMVLSLTNEGWGELRNVSFEFDLERIESTSGWDRPFPYRVEIGSVNGGAAVDLKDGFANAGIDVEFLRRDWKSFGEDKVVFDDGAEMTRREYDGRSKRAMGKFFSKMYEGVFPMSALGVARVMGCLHFEEANHPAHVRSCLMETRVQLNGPLPRAPALPSFQYEATLKSSGKDYVIAVPISHSIKAGEADRFCIRTSCSKSSVHDLVLELRTIDGAIHNSRPVALEMFVPRSLARIVAQQENRRNPQE